MIQSFYLFIVPLIIALVFLFVKYVEKKVGYTFYGKKLFIVEGEVVNNLYEVKDLLFVFFDTLKTELELVVNKILHWGLHFFVILLKYLSILIDALYAKSRDFFLYTATREKELVATFWHTLKEYKKEKDSE